MSNVLFISDLHLGHERVLEFAKGLRFGDNATEHAEDLVKCWNSKVTKRDTVYVLGDVCFDKEYLKYLTQLNGKKILVRGNHDDLLTTREWLEYFDDVRGLVKYKEFWLSHAPIHPQELRGKINIHGHVHTKYILDEYGVDANYVNVCLENTGGFPVALHEIRDTTVFMEHRYDFRHFKSQAYWRYHK